MRVTIAEQSGIEQRAGGAASSALLRQLAGRTRIVLFAAGLLPLLVSHAVFASGRYPAQFAQPKPFRKAIATATTGGATSRATGITVPHHLLAADLIARGFAAMEARRIDKVILLFPDHFGRTRKPFATAMRGFETALGPIDPSRRDIRVLLRHPDLVERSDLFATDHGIGAILPFVAHYLPGAKIVPIAVALGSLQEDWDRLVVLLARIAGPKTLVVQSTDFSHHLPQREALRQDQDVLNILAGRRLDLAARLRQPRHLDSRGSQYIQMRLQRDRYGADPVVLFNANSQAYFAETASESTSYIVQLYTSEPPSAVGPDLPGSKVYCFAGDTFLGRGMLKVFGNDHDARHVIGAIQRQLNGCRLIVNLTGVVMADRPVNASPLMLAMPAEVTVGTLRALGIVAASLANNHSMDFGRAAYDKQAALLTAAGIHVLGQRAILDLGPFRLTGLTDIDNHSGRAAGLIAPAEIEALVRSGAKPPLFAMVSWGMEDDATPRPRQDSLTQSLLDAAVGLVVGVRPHVAAPGLDVLSGGRSLRAYSLGNFLFDQNSHISSGALLEVRVFDQGTFFARLVPHPNFLERAADQAQPSGATH